MTTIRIIVRYQNSEQIISWYGTSVPTQAIEDAIRTVFQLPTSSRLFLKDEDEDVVAIAPTLPPGACFNFTSPSPDTSSNTYQSPPTPAITSPYQPPATMAKLPPKSLSLQEDTTFAASADHHPSSSSLADSLDDISNASLKRDSLEDNADDDEDEARKKRKRRKAVEIDRSFRCSMANCQKVYGSENALKMHIKLKHPEYQYLIMQQQMPLHQKPPPIVVSNKMLSSSSAFNGAAKFLAGAAAPTSALFKQQLASLLAKEAAKYPPAATGLPSNGSGRANLDNDFFNNGYLQHLQQQQQLANHTMKPLAPAYDSGKPSSPPSSSSSSDDEKYLRLLNQSNQFLDFLRTSKQSQDDDEEEDFSE
eukprot:gene5651-6521_t